ncbi:MAG: Flp pilus assembly complex ATPase component TadA [Planctomycetes bacterium]|nr:Flp pilus assembly complex ATPase component TadA [Planctomycetota bacterium]
MLPPMPSAEAGGCMEDFRLGAILLEGGIVDEAGLERCLAIQALTGGGRPLGRILVEQRLLAPAELQRVLDLQQRQVAEHLAATGLDDLGCAAVLAAARAAQADEVVVSEGRPVRMRIGCAWRQLSTGTLGGPEVWDLVRELMGVDVLAELAEHHFVAKVWDRGEAGRGSAQAFRHFDGVAVRIRFVAAMTPAAEAGGLPATLVETVRGGKGLVLVAGERGRGWPEVLAPLVQAASGEKERYVVVAADEPLPLPGGGAVVVQRRYGLSPAARAATLRSIVREDPDVLVVADVGSAETFELALRAAEGGRLVVACLDAATAPAVLQRALGSYSDHDLPRVRSSLAAVLRAVFVRHLLPDAKHGGVVAATELLLVDDAVREIVRGGDPDDLALLLRAEDSRCGHPLDRHLLELVLGGRVRLADAFDRAEDKAWLLDRTASLVPTD